MIIYKIHYEGNEYEKVLTGTQTAQWRKNDRDFQIGDILILHEYENEKYTYRTFIAKVTDIIPGGHFNMPQEYCVMSIKACEQSYCTTLKPMVIS